jgi:hypothetical protein
MLLMAASRYGRPVKAVIDDLFHALFHHATALCGVDESHAALLSRLFMPLASHYAALIESELLQSHNVASRNLCDEIGLKVGARLAQLAFHAKLGLGCHLFNRLCDNIDNLLALWLLLVMIAILIIL